MGKDILTPILQYALTSILLKKTDHNDACSASLYFNALSTCGAIFSRGSSLSTAPSFLASWGMP